MAVGERPRVLLPEEPEEFPGQVYIAVHAGDGGPALELRQWASQSLALAYSSLERFVDCCGADQPWMLVRSDQLAEWVTPAARDAGIGGVGFLLDEPIPEELRGAPGGMAGEEARWDLTDSPDWRVVWIASQRYSPGDEQAHLELRPMPGGLLALMTYTSADAVRAGAGVCQPAVAVPAGLLTSIRRRAGADTICLDTQLPEQARRTTGE